MRMSTKPAARPRFSLKPAAIAIALATGSALAAPTPNQMPGGGIVTAASLGSATPVGTTLLNLPNGVNVAVDGKVAIQWGGPGAPAGEATNPYGFNLGANAAMGFTGLSVGSAVLNIDASGNPSQIYGTLQANALGGFTPAVFVANANGIVVGAGGRIVAPRGVGLIGADLGNATSINDFVGNNGWVAPAAPSYGTSYLSFGSIPATGNVTIAGAINGDLAQNTGAPYIFVAGNNIAVLNTGNLFGGYVDLNAGLVAASASAPVGGVAGVGVSRFFKVDGGGVPVAGVNLGTNPGNLALAAGATGNVTNEGSIAAATVASHLVIQAAGSIRSGAAGSADTQVGLFSDNGIDIDSWSNTSTVELYNVVSGYTTNQAMSHLWVNLNADTDGFSPNVTLAPITPGTQPSAITTTGRVTIYGGNVTIDGTINHQSNPPGVNTDSLVIEGHKSVTIRNDIGAGGDVAISSTGPLTISGTVLANLDGDGAGGIFVVNDGAGAATTISGLLRVPATSNDSIRIYTNGPTDFTSTSDVINLSGSGGIDIQNLGTGAGNYTAVAGHMMSNWSIGLFHSASPAVKPMAISGNLEAQTVYIDNLGGAAGNTTTIAGDVSASAEIYVTHDGGSTGMLTATGTLTAPGRVLLLSDGNAQVRTVTSEGIYATVLGTSFVIDGKWTAADGILIDAPRAMTRLTPAGVLAGYGVRLNGLSFTGVSASGGAYANPGEKPNAQIVTSHLYVNLTGSINGPVAGNTNWLLNSLDVAPWYTLGPVHVHITANGGGFQAVNLRVLGDAIVDSGATRTPFIGVPLSTGGVPAGGIQGNLGSQLILQADGYMQVMGAPTGSLFGPPQAFQWPGGATFKAGTTLQTFAPIYNAWSVSSPPFGGIFFEAPYIALGGYVATSGTAWANFSTQPVTGDPTIYQIRQLAPNAFGFAATTAFVQNAYSNTVTGGAVCTTTGPSTWVVCP